MTSDVVIVGAGPTGLLLASELALAGVDPIVLERLPEPTGLSKAMALLGRSVDMLERRGLLDRFAERAPVGPPVFAHFAMLPLDLAVVAELGLRGILLPQAQTEEILLERALELGVKIRRNQEVDGLAQEQDGVTLTVGGQRVRARFVVGCDGGSSTVRKLAGIGFPGIPLAPATTSGLHRAGWHRRRRPSQAADRRAPALLRERNHAPERRILPGDHQ